MPRPPALILTLILALAACSDTSGPGREPPAPTASLVSAGIHHSCGLSKTGDTYCWGAGYPAIPTRVAGAPAFATIGTGVMFNCALTPPGTAYCWGRSTSGELGDGTTTFRNEPGPVAGGHTFASLATGIFHSCAITTQGAAWCWGSNVNGQLGDGTTVNRATPVAVAGGLTFRAIDTYSTTTCGLTMAGQTYCWGFNKSGQVGDGTAVERHVPTRVAGDVGFASLAVGGTSCGLTAAGEAWCWGIGHGLTPTAITGAPPLVSLSSGGTQTCGLTAGGQAYCWGSNAYGQLGDGTTTERATARTAGAVAGGLTFASISATGFIHACGVTTGGVSYCWGDNANGQLGDGTTTVRLTPTRTAAWVGQG
jgi:alpha-tubulin suppressor-like RCC1 family protein